jgi:hypothetical protein
VPAAPRPFTFTVFHGIAELGGFVPQPPFFLFCSMQQLLAIAIQCHVREAMNEEASSLAMMAENARPKSRPLLGAAVLAGCSTQQGWRATTKVCKTISQP